jgi:formyltetrahydrofolate deformylase
MAPPPDTATLLVSCPDRRGIVAALAQLLHWHGANTVDSDRHTDPEAGVFFQRIRFDLSDLVTDRISLSRAVRWHLEDRVLVYGDKTVVFS